MRFTFVKRSFFIVSFPARAAPKTSGHGKAMAKTMVLDASGRVLLARHIAEWEPRGIRGAIERDLNVHPLAYTLEKLEEKGSGSQDEPQVFYVVRPSKESLVALFFHRADDKEGPSSNHVRKSCLGCRLSVRDGAARPEYLMGLEAERVWLELSKALAGLAPRFTRCIHLAKMFEPELFPPQDDDDDESVLLGVLSFDCQEEVTTDDGLLVVVKFVFSVQAAENNVFVGATLDLKRPEEVGPDLSVPLAAIWNRGYLSWDSDEDPEKRAAPSDGEMTVASTGQEEDAALLTWLILCRAPVSGKLTFSHHEEELFSCAPVLLDFVQGADLKFWMDPR